MTISEGPVKINMNGIELDVERGTTVLEVARFLGIDIPTLCFHEGLSSYGACRLCVVESRKGNRRKLVASCVCSAEAVEGSEIRTHSEKVLKARRMLIELLLSECPQSKTIQDLASKHGVQRVRFKVENKQCILCGLCVRMCAEQMDARAIGFVNRGVKRRITTPFDMKSEACRTCGACMYICPVCQLRCSGPEALKENVCGSCLSLEPSCSDSHSEYMCYMGGTGSCGTCIKEQPKEEEKEGVRT